MGKSNQPLLPDVGVIALVYHDWGPHWSGPHYMLTRLAHYFRVVWVNPAHEWGDLMKRIKKERAPYTETSQPPGFTVYTPEIWLPRLYKPPWLARFSFRQRLKRASKLLTDQGCEKIILYLWRPEFEPALSLVPFDLSCYHINDEYSFSDVEMPLSETEARLIAAVDQVFIISPGLLEKKGGINPNTALARVGVDFQTYSTPMPEPGDLAAIPHPRVGYTGFIKKQLDWSLLLHLTEEHPDWSFVFVGGQNPHPEIRGAIQTLAGRRNVYFLGAKPTLALAAYPQHFDVCIMPYRASGYTKYIYPLKLSEYLASGRPVVGTRIRSLEEFADLVALPSTPAEWSAAIAEALTPAANSPAHRAAREAVAKRHDWQLLVGCIAKTLAQRLGHEFSERLPDSLGMSVDPVRRTHP